MWQDKKKKGNNMGFNMNLIPYLDSYYKNGLAVEDLDLSDQRKKILKMIINAFEFYQQNPWFTDTRKFFKECGLSRTMACCYAKYVEYLKNSYSTLTTAEAKNMVDYAAKTAMRSAAAAGDRHGMIKAADLLVKAHQLDKPEAEHDGKQARPLDIIFTPRVESIDPERHTIEDKQMRAILSKYGGVEDKTEIAIEEKLTKMLDNKDTMTE